MTSPPTTQRRPIASRNLPIFQSLAALLRRAHISAHLISILGMLVAFAAAAALIATPYVSPFHENVLYLAAAAGIQLRLLANMLGGMVAIESGQASPLGELYNEIPDRLSDTALLVAAGYATFSDPALGWAAACVALFVTYLRTFGKSAGISGLFIGPMSKSHRMFTLTLACLYLGITPDSFQPIFTPPHLPRPVGLMAIALAIVILGGLLSAVRRMARIVHALKERN